MKVLNQITEIVEANEVSQEELMAIRTYITSIIYAEEIMELNEDMSFEQYPEDRFLRDEEEDYLLMGQIL